MISLGRWPITLVFIMTKAINTIRIALNETIPVYKAWNVRVLNLCDVMYASSVAKLLMAITAPINLIK